VGNIVMAFTQWLFVFLALGGMCPALVAADVPTATASSLRSAVRNKTSDETAGLELEPETEDMAEDQAAEMAAIAVENETLPNSSSQVALEPFSSVGDRCSGHHAHGRRCTVRRVGRCHHGRCRIGHHR
jgi:hypothetical protein